jgi:two-component system alkaline phosphatase synthesis response regulator PhoP
MAKEAKIMLIDDDADFIASTETVLESQDYKVFTAADGEEGLRKVKEVKPDLILLDIIMPVADGFTVAKALSQDTALGDIPVLMLTSYAAKGAGTAIPRDRGYDLDAEDYLEKPVSPADLLAAVKKHLS